MSFNLGPVVVIERLHGGRLNNNWRVVASNGAFALKQLVHTTPSSAERAAHVIELLQATFPLVPLSLRSELGYLVRQDGHVFSAAAWASGDKVSFIEVNADHACELGSTLALAHKALSGAEIRALIGVTSPKSKPVLFDVDKAWVHLLETERLIKGSTEFDERARTAIARRREVLKRQSGLAPAEFEVLDPGIIHGDYHLENILWRNGRVNAVLDWDRVALESKAFEVVRAALLNFRTPSGAADLRLISRFVAAYRGELDLDPSSVSTALNRLWWRRCVDLWHLDFHYRQSDQTSDDLFEPSELFFEWWTANCEAVRRAFGA